MQAEREICVGVSQMETMPFNVPVTQRVEVRSAGNRQHSTELSLPSKSQTKKINSLILFVFFITHIQALLSNNFSGFLFILSPVRQVRNGTVLTNAPCICIQKEVRTKWRCEQGNSPQKKTLKKIGSWLHLPVMWNWNRNSLP